MVREAWNSVHAVHKQIVQGANRRKQYFEDSMTRKPAFAPHSGHFDKHEEKPFDVIYCLYKWSNLIGCYA